MSSPNHTEIADTARLTRREVEILSLIVEGHSSKKVADLLFVSKRTVDFHLDRSNEYPVQRPSSGPLHFYVSSLLPQLRILPNASTDRVNL